MGRMSIKGSIDGSSVAGVGHMTGTGLHVTLKPTAFGTLGAYKLAAATGAIGAGASADSQIFSARWTSTTTLAVITKIQVTGLRATTAFAAGVIDLKATIARAFTAAASGGTALTITGNNGKLRTSMGTTGFGAIRVSTTAALTAGTQTLDTQDLGFIATHSSGGVGSATPIIGSIYLPNNGVLFEADLARGEHPLVLAAEEGVVVRATVPATGVWNASIEMTWQEVSVY